MKLETFGVEEQNSIYLNDKIVAILPSQKLREGLKRPNYWTREQYISISTDNLFEGFNNMKICAEQIKIEPEFPGDKDDFQFRNLRLIAK